MTLSQLTVNITVNAVFEVFYSFIKVGMGFFIQDYQDFRGNVLDLSDLAIKCSNFLGLPGETEKINERTIRYYVTEGLVDRPTRIGRDAEYEYIHLLQFLASRFLVASGYPMAKVAPYIASRSIDELEKFVSHPTKPNLAELLVASFAKGSNTGLESISQSKRAVRTTPKSPRLEKSDIRFSVKSQSSLLDFDVQDLPAIFSKVPTENKNFTNSTKSDADENCQREIARLQNQMQRMQARLDDGLLQMSDRIEQQFQKQFHQVDDLHRAMQQLREQFQEDRKKWYQELHELKQMIHDRLPPIEAERAPSPERAQASNAPPEAPPQSSKNT